MVAVDLSQGAIAGWHSTIFPPFFVAGALYSGFALVVLLGLILRRWLRLGEFLHDAKAGARRQPAQDRHHLQLHRGRVAAVRRDPLSGRDRKSTRLNSSH